MGLFGIKKANEDPKPSNTFFNQDVINAEDYSNMPNNTVVGYANPTLDIQNVEDVNYNNPSNETFVYSQVDTNDFNNQFVSMNMNNNVSDNQVNDYNNAPMYQEYSDYGSVPMEQSYVDYNSTSDYGNVSYEQNFSDVNNQMNYMDNSVVENPYVDNNQVVVNDSYIDNNQGSVDSVVMTIDNNAMYDQNVNSIPEQVPFDNSALFALPEGAVVEEEPVVEEEVVVPEVVEEVPPEPVLNPLDNGVNPVPVNPVAEGPAPDELALFDEEEEVKVNLFTVINLMIGVIIKPGSTIVENGRKYKRMFDSMALVFWVSMLSFVMCLAGRIIAGCFSRTHDAISGASKISLNFSSLVDTNNYVPHLMVTFMIGLVAILIVALVYYFASFVHSKGIHIGIYFAVSALSLVPVIVGFTLLHPIISILSSDIALLALIFTVIYALIILFTGINSIVKFKTEDGRLIYNAINLAIVFSIMVFIFSTLSTLNIIDLTFILS